MSIIDITTQEVKKLYDNGDAIIVDTRSAEQYNKEHITNAININDFNDSNISLLSKYNQNKKAIILQCNRGGGSKRAANKIKDIIDFDIYNMVGGIQQWKIDNFSVTK